ncbi:MAG: helix-turn-helix domain-containing protein [Anaerolineales bacterium]|nr:helix-turn-helix domain-containing protein [Anaerolineales bacterium]
MVTNGEWLTVKEAVNISGYNPEHITRLIRQGKIKAKKFSIVWQVNRDSLLAYIETQKKPHRKPHEK